MAARAEDVQTDGRWRADPFGAKEQRWSQYFRKHKGKFGFGLAGFALLVGWLLRDRHLLTAEHGIGYVLGIVSVACMLILLLYPLRKRFKFLKFIGPMPKWFRNHMMLGVSAPIIALYHANFQLGSTNSRIALFSAIVVAASGLIGRFIYSKIHHGLYGRKANLKELLERVKLTPPDGAILGNFVPELLKRMEAFDKQVLTPPDSFFDCLKLALTLNIRTRVQRFKLNRFVRHSLVFHSRRSKVVDRHLEHFEKIVRKYIKTHLRHVRRVAEFAAYDRLFALWHSVHFPFFVLLLFSVVIHVVAVHIY